MATLNYVNPFTDEINYLEVQYPIIDYGKFKRLHEYNNDSDLIKILDNILKDLDCTKEYNGIRFRTTTYPIYSMFLSDYYFYVNKIVNQFIYNEYIDKLIKRHIDNIVFEHDNPYIINTKTNKKKKKSPPNKFVKYTTKDMFTNKSKYVYCNYKTDEQVESDNPDLLDKLNAKISKRKQTSKRKQIGVPLSAMTFNFKKKK